MIKKRLIKNKRWNGLSLLEVLVALGIFSMLLVMTTTSLVRIMRIKMDVEARAAVADNLEYTMESMKRHLLEANAALVECGETPSVCTICSQADANAGLCDEYKAFVYNPQERKITFNHGDKNIRLTSSGVEVTGVTFQQVDDYVFIMLKAVDEGGKIIPEDQPVIVQSSVVIRNE